MRVKRTNETPNHKKLKELVNAKLSELFGVSLTEYQSSGHEYDVFTCTYEGIKIMAEIVWTASKGNFDSDMVLILQSGANVKLLIVSPAVYNKLEFQRAALKSILAERQKGYILSPMINGGQILNERKYLDSAFKNLVMDLVKQAREIKPRDSGPESSAVWQEDCEDGVTENVFAEGVDAGVVDKRGLRTVKRNIFVIK